MYVSVLTTIHLYICSGVSHPQGQAAGLPGEQVDESGLEGLDEKEDKQEPEEEGEEEEEEGETRS